MRLSFPLTGFNGCLIKMNDVELKMNGLGLVRHWHCDHTFYVVWTESISYSMSARLIHIPLSMLNVSNDLSAPVSICTPKDWTFTYSLTRYFVLPGEFTA